MIFELFEMIGWQLSLLVVAYMWGLLVSIIIIHTKREDSQSD